MPLDLGKLVNLQRDGADWKAQCPACAELGLDTSGRHHLHIFKSGAFGCAVTRDSNHYSRIYSLAGVNGTAMPAFQPHLFEPVELPRTWPADCLDRLIKDHSYWRGRGVSPATVEPFRGGVATEGSFKNRYVIPVFGERDEIVGFTGRALWPDAKPKWKHMGRVAAWVWGGLDEIGDRAVIVESPGDVLMLREHGVPETLCLFGLNMSEAVLGCLIAHSPRQIVISTNRDEDERKGPEAALRIMDTLETFFEPGQVSIVHPDAKDWGESTPEQIRETFLGEPATAVAGLSDSA